MNVQGTRSRRTRLVHTDRFVIAVDVELVTPIDAPDEPCYEAATIKLLEDVKTHAAAGDIEWLMKHGKVYEAVMA